MNVHACVCACICNVYVPPCAQHDSSCNDDPGTVSTSTYKRVSAMLKSSKHMQKNTEYGYLVLLKKSKQKIGGHSALYFMLFWCSDFRQSMDTSF